MSIIPTAYAVDLKSNFGFGKLNTVADLINTLLGPAFAIAAVAVTFYLIFGAFKYLSAGPDKEAVAGARNMIIHAIVGIVLLLFMVLFLKFIPEALNLNIKIF